MTSTIGDVRTAVQGMDPELLPDDDSFRTAVVLLSSAVVGADDGRIAGFTGEPLAFVSGIGANMRASDTWLPDGTVSCNWFDEDDGGLSFWMDVLVGQGMFEKV